MAAWDGTSTVASVLCFRAGFRDRRAGGFRSYVRWLIGSEVRAEVVDQSIAVLGINIRAPLDHLVHLSSPGCLAQALLHDDARLVATQTRGRSLFLRGARWQLLIRRRPSLRDTPRADQS